MTSLPEKDAEEDHGDVGLAISSNGHEYPMHSVFSTQIIIIIIITPTISNAP